ncbi:hypothetical protein VTN77DRAFT_3972 [Rasamsonia byssochlamydoides]|uniref:uncharacterized protein n=1 Tax=Rasamsonia byssochlamydoides TaxID=89139 RepID=UPI003743371D
MADIPLPITYTPTTHRISKAKKGKRVHACEFPGCNKVFTRAEHRRRHELNHNPEASFRCTYAGCRKAFHRSDLLARHMERHELDAKSDGGAGRHWRQQSKSSITSAPTSLVNQMPPIEATSASYPASQVSTPMSSTSSVIGTPIQQDLAGDLSLSWNGIEIPLQPRPTFFGSHIRDSADDLSFYSSPETCASPSSDGAGFVIPSSAPTSVMEPFASGVFHSDLTASPLQLPTTTREWDPLDAVSASPMMPFSLDGSDMIQPVVPIPLSNLDGDEWFALRRELTSAPGVVSGNDGMEIVDTVKWQDCFECYWQHFHPLFPIVHRPTFFVTKPSPLLAGAMVAIGSQYDTRPNAKEYSLSLLEACLKLLSKRPAITSRSRVTDIQAVFLLEFLSKFRSRKADVQISHRFRSLYGSFMQDRHWVSQNPLAVLNTLPRLPSADALKSAQKFWVEHEARRRVLQAAFIFDIQQSVLFSQPPVLLQPSSGTSSVWEQSSRIIDLPFPCSSDLWESRQLEDWLSLARASSPTSLASVAATFGEPAGLKAEQIDTFQSTLLLAYGLSGRARSRDLEGSLGRFASALEMAGSQQTGAPLPVLLTSPHSRTLFGHHALLAARYTPGQALLTVSGESWLFNRKLPQEGDFRVAKGVLRQWVSDTDDVRKAVWHAVRALQYAVVVDAVPTASWSSFHPAEPLDMLQTNWSLYICALICWAYGFEANTSSSALPIHQASSSSSSNTEVARAYIDAMVSMAPTWEHISRERIPVAVRCNTVPLLVFVRTTRLQEGRMGGLLNEAERVLARLTEPRTSHADGIRGMWSF